MYDAVIALRDSLLQGDQDAISGRVLGSVDASVSNLADRLAGIGARYERAQAAMAKTA